MRGHLGKFVWDAIFKCPIKTSTPTLSSSPKLPSPKVPAQKYACLKSNSTSNLPKFTSYSPLIWLHTLPAIHPLSWFSYANGNLHIGHMLNKLLKDFIKWHIKLKYMSQGYTESLCSGVGLSWSAHWIEGGVECEVEGERMLAFITLDEMADHKLGYRLSSWCAWPWSRWLPHWSEVWARTTQFWRWHGKVHHWSWIFRTVGNSFIGKSALSECNVAINETMEEAGALIWAEDYGHIPKWLEDWIAYNFRSHKSLFCFCGWLQGGCTAGCGHCTLS